MVHTDPSNTGPYTCTNGRTTTASPPVHSTMLNEQFQYLGLNYNLFYKTH